MKVSELTGAELDYWVAKAEALAFPESVKCAVVSLDGICRINYVNSRVPCESHPGYLFNPSSNWAKGGPIIERENIHLRAPGDASKPSGEVVLSIDCWYARKTGEAGSCIQSGPTPLIAAMRAYVASKFGD